MMTDKQIAAAIREALERGPCWLRRGERAIRIIDAITTAGALRLRVDLAEKGDSSRAVWLSPAAGVTIQIDAETNEERVFKLDAKGFGKELAPR